MADIDKDEPQAEETEPTDALNNEELDDVSGGMLRENMQRDIVK